MHITSSLISLPLNMQPSSVRIGLPMNLAISQSSGQGSESSPAGAAAVGGAATVSATFSLTATFAPEPDEESDTGAAGA